jgi:hypothetical protein
MIKNRLPYSLFLVLAGMWWGWTLLVDIFVVPTVFRTLSNFFEAGDLGILVFSKLNNLEIVVSTSLLALLAYQLIKTRKPKMTFGICIVLWLIVMTYFSFLTPKIIALTEAWKITEVTSAIDGIDPQQEHQFYHTLYVRMDVIKLTLLSLVLGLALFRSKEWE